MPGGSIRRPFRHAVQFRSVSGLPHLRVFLCWSGAALVPGGGVTREFCQYIKKHSVRVQFRAINCSLIARRLLMNRVSVLALVGLALTAGAPAQNSRDRQVRRTSSESIPTGTQIPIRIDRGIDVRIPSDGRVFTGTVAEDVMGRSNDVLIPRGARAELIVQNLEGDEGTVDLESISFDGRRYMVNADRYELSRRSGVGANERTAKYVGGGALFGTLLGALAGGGKGAAIGAAAGGAAGAGAQTITRGKSVNVPSETVLTFRLDEPLRVAVDPYTEDRGYDDNGNHYHNNYYRRDNRR